ncbi:orexin receptor type 2-like [Ylistrum balloti]|uniref:orexin receptor type 2-like n=1 Tax=Ylistrum balloti TaxID=509963 RepID=UPI002905C155|nr:orexin receptor type 2-like [Ylistrum balloti]
MALRLLPAVPSSPPANSSLISVNQYAVTFTNDAVCKAFWVFSLFTTGTSIFTLLLIAVHRYQKICRPFQPQMTHRRKQLGLVVCIVVAMFTSLPALVFYGTSPVSHPKYNITGTRCANIRGPWTKAVAISYKAAILLIGLGILVSLVVLYCLIGRAVFRRIDFNKKRQEQTSIPNAPSSMTSRDTIEYVSEDRNKLSPRTTTKTKKIPGYRLSIMFMLITGVFVVCFIPKLAMMVFESRQEQFWFTLDISGYKVFRFLYTMYIINSIANPIIYGFHDRKFRQELASLCCNRCNCISLAYGRR